MNNYTVVVLSFLSLATHTHYGAEQAKNSDLMLKNVVIKLRPGIPHAPGNTHTNLKKLAYPSTEDIVDIRINVFNLMFALHTFSTTDNETLPFQLTKPEMAFILANSRTVQNALVTQSTPKLV